MFSSKTAHKSTVLESHGVETATFCCASLSNIYLWTVDPEAIHLCHVLLCRQRAAAWGRIGTVTRKGNSDNATVSLYLSGMRDGRGVVDSADRREAGVPKVRIDTDA